MVRLGSPEWKRRRMFHTSMFFGFILCVYYSLILENRGRLVADVSLIVGVGFFVTGLLLTVRERIQKLKHLRTQFP